VTRIDRIDREPTEAGTGANGGAAGARQTAAPRDDTAAPPCDFALALERRGSGTAVLVLAGELDLYRAPDIEKALTGAIGLELHNGRRRLIADGQLAGADEMSAEEVRHLTIDLRSVTFIDSTTLELLLAASRHQQARGGKLLVLVGPQTPMTAFEVTGFDRLLAIRREERPAKRQRRMNATRLRSPEQASERRQAVSGSLELQQALRQENEQLRTALASRIVIEQAKGMLAERFEIDVDEAFERLRHQARSHRIKLHVLAAAVTAREAWAEAIVRPAEPRKPP
jgi:anti-anti-sigma regulatory factor